MTNPNIYNNSPQSEEIVTSLHSGLPELPPHHSMMDDLYCIGPDKPLGYLPNSTIVNYSSEPAWQTQSLLESRGLSTSNQSEEECGVIGGALYAYDSEALNKLLRENAETLRRSGWPVDADAFVERVGHETVHEDRDPDLFRLIAWTFKDPQPEYRREGVEYSASALDRWLNPSKNWNA
jgi:hypothetical protein